MSIGSLRDILLHEWDPHDVGRRLDVYGESARFRYDTYLQPLMDLVAGGADEEGVMAYLAEREGESMCFPGLGRERLRGVARKVIAVLRPGG
jgi:hypothetical protein